MFFIMLKAVFICATVGLLLHFFLDSDWVPADWQDFKISWREFAITLAIISIVVVPATAAIGWKLAVNNKLSFEQYINGWESSTKWDRIQCHRDGRCEHHYSCDPYTVYVTYTYTCGKSTCTGTRAETHYHDCPYVTEEWNFYVGTTIGDFTIDEGRFPEHANAYAWRSGVGVPSDVPSGIPSRWQEVHSRLDSLRPGPVTAKSTYINYVLASDNTILKKFGNDIKEYQQHQLLPVSQPPLYDLYRANKVQFIGGHSRATDRLKWNTEIAYLNAGLGTIRQGDVEVIIVNHSFANTNPSRYVQTLEAYFKSWEHQKEYATAKNDIVIVLGTTNDSTIAWAQGFTGMPNGNELLLQTVSDFKGKRLDPVAISGEVRKVSGIMQMREGSLGDLTIQKDGTRFQRMEMKKYAYLKGEIVPSSKSMTVLYIVCTLLAVLGWIAPILYDDSTQKLRRYYREY